MKIINGLEELKSLVGQEIGVSDWLLIDQERINAFADATGDHQWIHINAEMAAKSPFGSTIAHGFLTLSLMPMLMDQIWKLEGVRMGVNYGTNKVRFTAPVPVNSKVRLRAQLEKVDDIPGGAQIINKSTFEIEGQNKPACIVEGLSLVYF